MTWLADDLNLPLRNGTAVDFAFQYGVHLVDGADPEGDATLTLTDDGISTSDTLTIRATVTR